MLLVVPMVGSGTLEDPKRPAFVREAGVAYRYQLSDDGASAIVEAAPRGPLEAQKLENNTKTDARVKVFKPSRDKRETVDVELKKLKKDFDLDSFGKGPETGRGK